MKSKKTNPNSAKEPDERTIVSKLYFILLTTLELLDYIFLGKNQTWEFTILVSNLKDILPSVFS